MREPPKSSFAWRLRYALLLREMNAAGLANKLETDRGTVSRWMGGTRKPDGVFAAKLARELRVRFEWLLLGEGPLDDAGTPAPVPPACESLVDTVLAYPDRWSAVDVARAVERATPKHTHPHDGWEAVLDSVKDPGGGGSKVRRKTDTRPNEIPTTRSVAGKTRIR